MSIKALLPLQGHPRGRLRRGQQRLPRFLKALLRRRRQAVHIVLLGSRLHLWPNRAVHVLLGDPVVGVLDCVALWRSLPSLCATSSGTHFSTACAPLEKSSHKDQLMDMPTELPPKHSPCPQRVCSGLETHGLASLSLQLIPCCMVLEGQSHPASKEKCQIVLSHYFTFSQYMSSSSKALSVSIAARARVLMINFFGA